MFALLNHFLELKLLLLVASLIYDFIKYFLSSFGLSDTHLMGQIFNVLLVNLSQVLGLEILGCVSEELCDMIRFANANLSFTNTFSDEVNVLLDQ